MQEFNTTFKLGCVQLKSMRIRSATLLLILCECFRWLIVFCDTTSIFFSKNSRKIMENPYGKRANNWVFAASGWWLMRILLSSDFSLDLRHECVTHAWLTIRYLSNYNFLDQIAINFLFVAITDSPLYCNRLRRRNLWWKSGLDGSRNAMKIANLM